jgi:hypothetical protein
MHSGFKARAPQRCRYRVHRTAQLSSEQTACLASAGPLLNKLITLKSKEIDVAESMLDLAKAFSSSPAFEGMPHQRLATAPIINAKLLESKVPVSASCNWIAWSGQALSVGLNFEYEGDLQVDFATLAVTLIQSVSLSDASCHGHKNVRFYGRIQSARLPLLPTSRESRESKQPLPHLTRYSRLRSKKQLEAH